MTNTTAMPIKKMTAAQSFKWKACQMIKMRLEQAREAKAKGQYDLRKYCVESALNWRKALQPKRRQKAKAA